MKFAIAVLCLLPLAFCVPVEERDLTGLLNGALGLFGIDLTQLKSLVSGIAATLEADATEQQCEAKCGPVLIQVMHGHNTVSDLLTTLCPFICRSFQGLAHQLNVHVATP